MSRRIFAIAFIFACTALAWWILGGTIFSRTYSSDSDLKGKVMQNWGAPQTQGPPTANYGARTTQAAPSGKDAKDAANAPPVTTWRWVPMPLDATRVNAALSLDYRQKGLLWYSTYLVDFAGDYTFRNPSSEDAAVEITFKFPAAKALYDNLQVSADGAPLPTTVHGDSLTAATRVKAGQPVVVHVGYRSHGLDNWNYNFGPDVMQVRDFHLRVVTDFRDVDFPANALSPTSKRETPGGWQLDWDYTSLVSGFQIGVTMPEKLQPGPLAGRISLFAPVSLFFFFFLIFILTTLRGIDLHPMNYFFLATAFFAFHLLLAYLVDHISIHLAFVICSAVSIFLVVTYLRLVVGVRFALLEAGVAQFVYLVLFSYAFFFQGFTGLAVTIGAIVTLFLVMQMTGRIRWADKFASPPVAVRQNPLL